MGRMTLQGALRYDRAWSYFPEVTIGPVRFLPTAITYAETPGVTGYNDITPRGGLAWDLFGTGKTSLKVNAGKYLQAAQNGLAYARAASERTSDDDGHADVDRRRRRLRPRLRSAESAGQQRRRSLRADQRPRLRQQRFTSDLDRQLVSGWGVRPGDWQIGASVQQQLLPRVSAEIGYTPSLADQLHLGRQRAAGDQSVRRVQRHGAERSASAGRGARPDDQRPLQRQPERRVAGQQHHHAGERLPAVTTRRSTTASCSTSARARAAG